MVIDQLAMPHHPSNPDADDFIDASSEMMSGADGFRLSVMKNNFMQSSKKKKKKAKKEKLEELEPLKQEALRL